MPTKDFIRQRFFPHLWCAGCGHGTIMASLVQAIEELNLPKNNVVLVSGIGCSSRLPGYLDFHTLHTLHGRALAFTAGIKLGRPELTVIVLMGDGDASAIGGNHLIHAARRNIDMTAIVLNNSIYGMTGGQNSPTTPLDALSATTPRGNIDPAFDLVELAKGAGASFVARSTAYHFAELKQMLVRAISHRGFSFVEAMSGCPTYYGRRNKLGSGVDLMRMFRDRTVPMGSDKKNDDPSLIERGIFVEKTRPSYTDQYRSITQGAGEDS
ncbi:MAG TPA: 2-oxoacid:ferredoxin oxidoreductase subunit beta [Dissulfurispiraceae bacterium]|nr:2-oxoacid:ferredoxin oxidoreductase subunit beta [Dissulfurispiraceae bacterium]